MKRIIPMLLTLAGCSALAIAADKPTADEIAKTKKALQDVGDFVGQWKANGEAKVSGKNILWKETINWGWKFDKDGNAWIAFDVENGKYFKKGTLKYALKDKKFILAVKDKDDRDQTFTGTLNRGRLLLERKDDKTQDVHRLIMNTAAEGVRFLMTYEVQEGGKGLFSNVYKIAANKEGESLAGGGKKNECIVTGGLGTIAVSFEGKTYYVCCSGCRDEFNDNPKKYIDAAAKKK